jgi:hypothetical protein
VTSAPWERVARARGLVGLFATVYVLVRFPYLTSAHPAGDFHPIGIVLLAEPLPRTAVVAITIAAIALGAAYVAGTRVGRVGFPIALLWVTTYASSWGKILHSENLLVMHVAILAFASGATSAGWFLRLASIVTVLTYFVAGVTKLRVSGTAWLAGDPLGLWLRWDALRKIELGSFASPLATFVAGRPALLRVLAIYTLIVELGAPFALLSRRTTYAWAALAWCFHVGILATMAIGFFYPLSGVAFASMFPLERVRLRPAAP